MWQRPIPPATVGNGHETPMRDSRFCRRLSSQTGLTLESLKKIGSLWARTRGSGCVVGDRADGGPSWPRANIAAAATVASHGAGGFGHRTIRAKPTAEHGNGDNGIVSAVIAPAEDIQPLAGQIAERDRRPDGSTAGRWRADWAVSGWIRHGRLRRLRANQNVTRTSEGVKRSASLINSDAAKGSWRGWAGAVRR